GAVAADADALRIDIEQPGVPGEPCERRVGVVVRRGPRVLRCAPVVDARDEDAGIARERAAEAVVGADAAGDPSAAVQVDERRQRSLPRPVQAHRDLVARAGDPVIVARDAVGGEREASRDRLGARAACARRRIGAARNGRADAGVEGVELGIERQGHGGCMRALRAVAAWAHYNQYRSTRCRDAPRASIRSRLSMNRMHRIASCLAALTLFALAPRAASAFTLTSAEVKPGGSIAAEQVYKGFGCTGENVSPSLAWKDPPSGTKSFAVTVY